MARTVCAHIVPSLLLTSKSSFRTHFLFSGASHFDHVMVVGRRFSSASKISMILRAGIVGLPNAGKSTLFNAVPNVGVVAVPDPRLHQLSDLSKSIRAVPAFIDFVDIAGLVKGASQGEGLGNKFLSHIREVDSILQIVRCFEDNDIVDVNGKIDPKTDIDVLNLELVFSDLDQEVCIGKNSEGPYGGKPARSVTLSDFEKDFIKHLCLFTMKPVIYVAIVAESVLAEPASNPHVKEVASLASELLSGTVESELSKLPSEDRFEYLKSLGNLIRATYNLLGLRTYFTSGMTAPQAAGVIHADFERGFIRAETVAYDDFVAAGSFAAAREKGLLRAEGKEYIVQEGDVMLFRFNV